MLCNGDDDDLQSVIWLRTISLHVTSLPPSNIFGTSVNMKVKAWFRLWLMVSAHCWLISWYGCKCCIHILQSCKWNADVLHTAVDTVHTTLVTVVEARAVSICMCWNCEVTPQHNTYDWTVILQIIIDAECRVSDVHRVHTFTSDAVHNPVISLQVHLSCCHHYDVLHVTPRQLWTTSTHSCICTPTEHSHQSATIY